MDPNPAVMKVPAGVPESDVVCSGLDVEQQLIAAQDTDSPNITNDCELPGKGTDPAGEESESVQRMIESAMEHSTGSSGDLAPEVPQSRVPCTTLDANRLIITNDEERPRKGTDPEGKESESDEWVDLSEEAQLSNSPNITNDNVILGKGTDPAGEKSESELWVDLTAAAHVLVAGETFQTHEAFIKKLNLQIELCSAESSSVILVFCPVVSRIGTDMEAAMARVTEEKPVILVFMHHCHDPSHMTNITVQPSRRNIVQVVHCAFHETKGLLECQENEQAVDAVDTTLQSFCRSLDIHNEVPQSTLTQLDMQQQPMGTQNAKRPNNTNDSELHKQSTESVGKEKTTGLSSPRQFSQWLPSPKKLKYSSLVKVHVLVAGETFSTHDTFIKKLESEIELCDPESCSVILVFCPVVSRIGTDMEAAMAGVKEDKPVILVFMHHCHNVSHMTNITVEPSRSNIEQVVHCSYHETKGLLQCQENEQAADAVRLQLQKYK